MKKQSDGRYRGKTTVGHDADGDPIVKYASGRTKAELAANIKELKRRYGAGGPGDLAEIMFKDYAEKWLQGKDGSVSDNSLMAYTSYIEQYLIPHLGNKQLRSILQSDIKLALAKLKHLSANTRRRTLSRLTAIFRQARMDGIRLDNPTEGIRMPADKEQKRRALTDDEKAAALKFIEDFPGTDEAKLVALSYYTSCRRGECFGPQWKHIDFKKRIIQVRQQLIYKKGGGGLITPRLKTKNSLRDMPMPQQLYDILFPLRGTPEAYVFQDQGKHYHPGQVEDLCGSIIKKCPALKSVTPHYYRHNYASLLYKKGVPVKEAAQYMGETVQVMLGTYVHIEKELGVKEGSLVYDVFSEVAKKLPDSST